MSVIREWAAQHHIPVALVEDLERRIAEHDWAPDPIHESTGQGSEARQQSLVRLDAARHGVWLTRNNVGALMDKSGRPVRYGLVNETKAQNTAIKSSDLVGIRSILIGPELVGRTIGQFCARECKHEGWQYTGNEHEQAQLAFINFINSKGGDASFATGAGTF